jgi:hypothetical protein
LLVPPLVICSPLVVGHKIGQFYCFENRQEIPLKN